MKIKVGFGYDVHRIEKTNKKNNITICGINIESHYKIIAHSDGDLGIHAVVDAILGSMGEGDIGDHFPPHDEKFKNMPSSFFLKETLSLCKLKSGKIVNVDITILAQEIFFGTRKKEMQKYMSEALSLPTDCVGIKAGTSEKVGSVGRSECITSHAVALLEFNQ